METTQQKKAQATSGSQLPPSLSSWAEGGEAPVQLPVPLGCPLWGAAGSPGAQGGLAHAGTPSLSHAPLPGEPARESPLLKAKVRDTETGTARDGWGKDRTGKAQGGGKERDRPRGKMRMRSVPAAPGWAPLTPSAPTPYTPWGCSGGRHSPALRTGTPGGTQTPML